MKLLLQFDDLVEKVASQMVTYFYELTCWSFWCLSSAANITFEWIFFMNKLCIRYFMSRFVVTFQTAFCCTYDIFFLSHALFPSTFLNLSLNDPDL